MVEVIIPNNITVHLGEPGSDAQNVTVPFIDYIKNVASSEIYPTWPEEALRANIYAQVTFALNRIFTGWYRSQGYPFDITNATQCDQSYQYGRDIFEPISEIVDDLFNDYVRMEGRLEPLFTQYCNGTTTTCDGLSQWGSVELANQGKTAIEILKNYYGDNIEIVENAQIGSVMQTQYPGAPVQVGDTGRIPSQIQILLNRISINYPAIPKVIVDGRYGEKTAEAVSAFQKAFDLNETGIVDQETWYEIIRIYVSVKKLSELNSEGISFEEISKQFPEDLSVGSTGEGVRVLQFFLSFISAFNDFIQGPDIDGVFGDQTKNSVIAFQQYKGLDETGIVDKNTWNEIYYEYRGTVEASGDDSTASIAEPYPGVVLRQGMTGESIKTVQGYLNYIALFFRAVNTVAPTGFYGPATTNSVRNFQREFNLPVDGAVNEATWNSIASVYSDLKAEQIREETQAPGFDLFQEQ